MDWLTYAALSLDIYRDKHQQAPLPEGWKLLFDCPKQYQTDGYFGAVYSNQTEIIIAHRGTANFKDVIEDIEMFLTKKIPAQFNNAAVPFIDFAIKKIQTDFAKDIPISFTGHSLGASIAELSTAKYLQNTNLKITPCYNFECPGTKILIEKMMAEGELKDFNLIEFANHVKTCNADIDAINSAFEHVNQATLVPHYIGYQPVSDHNYPLKPTLLYFCWDFTVENQHGMNKMYQYWKNGSTLQTQVPESFAWPIGVENAFQYYLQYEPYEQIEHADYWNQYMKLCWQDNISVYPHFDNSFEKFKNDFLKTVLVSEIKVE